MIGFLRGEVLELTDNRALLLVGGVGYQVALSQGSELASIAVGSRLDLYVHTHVREDAFDLYGFSTRIEKELFLLLLTVNGIGPKGALAVLSGLPPAVLVDAILAGEHGSLQKIPGVGKKTAERLVLELSDVLKRRPELLALAQSRPSAVPTPRVRVPEVAEGFAIHAFNDARAALVQLGFREVDVLTVLRRLESPEDGGAGGTGSPDWTPEEVVRQALRELR